MTRPLPFDFSQSVARNRPYSVLYIFHTSHFFESIPITWWERIAVRNVNFTKFSFIFRAPKKTVIRIWYKMMSISNFSYFTENWDCRKIVSRLHLYIEAWSEFTLLVPKCYLLKTHNQTAHEYTRWSECLHCLRIRVECTNSGDWSAYTSVTCDQWSMIPRYFWNKKKMLIKSICPMWTHPWLKQKWVTPKWNAAKCYIICIFHDAWPACHKHRKQLGQG